MFTFSLKLSLQRGKGNILASFPDPAQLSFASSTVKRERAWYLFSREWHQDRKDGRKGLIVCGHTGPRTKQPTYQVAYYMYLANGRQLSYTPSVEHVVSWKYAKRTLLVWQISDYIMLTWERLSPLFCTYCKRWKAGQGLGMRLGIYYILTL